jgi:PKD repeat protein
MGSSKGPLGVLSIAVLFLLVLVSFSPIAAMALAEDGDAGSRAEGAEGVQPNPEKINYYEDGYPPKPNVIYTMNMSVSFEWELTHSELNSYLNRVNSFQARWYDSTDGQMAIERVDLWNDKNHWDVTDVRWYERTGRAFTFRGGISADEAHIYLFSDDSSKVLNHEWGHYAMFLPDEYTDSGGAFCTCLMGSCFNTDEYCCESNHNSGHQYAEANSCWKQIKNRYGHVVEKDPPSSGPWDEPSFKVIWHELFDFDTEDGNLTIEPPQVNDGEDLWINVSFFNLNYSIDGDQEFSLYKGDPDAGGTLLTTQRFDVRDKTEFTVSFKRKAEQGLNEFYVKADPKNNIDEINENNNKAGGSIYVNVPPAIDPSLPESFDGLEDTDLTFDLTDYETDAEDSGTDLDWEVLAYDDTVLVDMTADLDEDEFTFTPKDDWYGKTRVDLRLSDSAGAFMDGYVDLVFESVNDLPSVTNLTVDKDQLLRGETAELVLRGDDIETMEKNLDPTIEYKTPVQGWTELEALYYDDEGFKTTLETDAASALGNYSFRAMVEDLDDGTSAWAYLNDSIEVMNNLPTIIGMVISEDTIYRTETGDITVAAEDMEDPSEDLTWEVEVQQPAGDWLPFDGNMSNLFGHLEFTFAPDEEAELGVYHFKAKATDKDGAGTGWLEDVTDVIVMNNLPVTEDLDVKAEEMYRTESIEVRAKGSDVEEDVSELEAEFYHSYGQAWVQDDLSEPQFDTVTKEWVADFTAPKNGPIGAVMFKVRFSDLDGESSEWIEGGRVMIRNNPPVANATGPTSGMEGETLKFFGQNSFDVEGDLAYQWSFSDGQTSNEIDPEHVFKDGGMYNVELTVKDSNGQTDSETILVNIEDKPEPPPIIGPPGQTSMFGGDMFPFILVIVAVLVVLFAIVGYVVHRRRKGKADDLSKSDFSPVVGSLEPPGEPEGAAWKDVDKPGPGQPEETKPEPGPPEPGPPEEAGPPEPGPPEPEPPKEPETSPPPPGPPPPGPPE